MKSGQVGDTNATGFVHPWGVNGISFFIEKYINKRSRSGLEPELFWRVSRTAAPVHVNIWPIAGLASPEGLLNFSYSSTQLIVGKLFSFQVTVESWLKGHHQKVLHLILIESWELSHSLVESSKDSIFKESIWIYYTTMDSTTQVTNDTALVIAMEVTVDKAAHYGQQSSDSMV